jgi:hypothetical protein
MENVTGVDPVPEGATPEFEFYQPFLFLQPKEEMGEVPATAAGVALGYGDDALSAEIEVGTWPAAAGTRSGTAVVQMRIRQISQGGEWEPMFTDPAYTPAPGTPTRVVYAQVRQEIEWTVKFETKDGALKATSASLWVTEKPLGAPLVDTPLRFINSSRGSAEVYLVGYPAEPGVARKDFDPTEEGAQDNPNIAGDQRADPATPIPNWDTKVEAKDK